MMEFEHQLRQFNPINETVSFNFDYYNRLDEFVNETETGFWMMIMIFVMCYVIVDFLIANRLSIFIRNGNGIM